MESMMSADHPDDGNPRKCKHEDSEGMIPSQTIIVSCYSDHPGLQITWQELVQCFQNDDPITKILFKQSYALLEFANTQSMRKTLHKSHCIDTPEGRIELILLPMASNDTTEEMDGRIDGYSLKLNDDCLIHIFSFLNLRELICVERVCERFQAVAKSIYRRCRIVNFDKIIADSPKHSGGLTIKEAKKILLEVGPYVNTLIATTKSFLTEGKGILNAILMSCDKLANVQLTNYDVSSKDTVEKLTKICATAKRIKLQRCRLTDKILMKLLKNATCLEALDVSVNCNIKGEFLSKIPKIVDLNVNRCNNIEPQYFIQFCEKNLQIRCLKMKNLDYVDRECIQALAKLKNLESLTMNIPHLGVLDIEHYLILADLPNLRHLTKCNPYGYHDERDVFLERLSNNRHLESLDISYRYIRIPIVRTLANFQHLRVLKLNAEIEEVNQEMLQCQYNNTVLEELHIVETKVGNTELVELIKRFSALRCIDLSEYCEGFTITFLRDVLPHLQRELELILAPSAELWKEIMKAGDAFADLIRGKIKLTRKHWMPEDDDIYPSEDDNTMNTTDDDDSDY